MTAIATTRAPGPRGDFLLGSLPQFRRDPLGLLRESVRDYGDVVRLRMGPVLVHLVNHPDHVEHVLVRNARNYDKQTRSVAKIRATCGNSLLSSDGESCRRHRRLIQPMFRPQCLERFIPDIAECTQKMLREWQTRAASKQPLDVVSEMARVTMRIAATILFGADVENDTPVIESALAVVLRDTWRRLESLFDTSTVSPAFHRPRFRRALQEIDRVVYRIIDERRRSTSSRADLLTTLLDSHGEGGEDALNDGELRDAVVTLLLSGHETTANALAWTLCLVSEEPEVEELLHQEAADLDPTSIRAADLPYTGMVFSEAIRLYPSIWIVERRAVAADDIGGYHIPAGSTVLVSPWLLHRHPAFWIEPEQFDPERFTPDCRATRMRSVYIPFGAGPHQCVGQHMALLVAQTVLGMIYQRFRLRLVPGQEIQPQPGITLRHAHGMKMTLQDVTSL